MINILLRSIIILSFVLTVPESDFSAVSHKNFDYLSQYQSPTSIVAYDKCGQSNYKRPRADFDFFIASIHPVHLTPTFKHISLGHHKVSHLSLKSFEGRARAPPFES